MTYDEAPLLAALLQDRRTYEAALQIGLEPSDFSDAGKLLCTCAGEQYKRDANIPAASIDILRRQVERRISDKAMAATYIDYALALPVDVSGTNVLEEYRLLCRARAAMELATALAQGKGDDVLLDRYVRLRDPVTDSISYRLTAEDFEGEAGERLPMSPKTLNGFLDGGVLRGHNITVFGRPDSGKSLFALNQAAYLCTQGYTVLYVANEEPAQDITRRLLSRLTSTPIARLNVAEAMQRCTKSYANWNLLHRAGATIKDIRQAAGHVRPDLIVVDQIKNITTGEDNRAFQLDRLARAVRELGIEFGAATLSVTQAGDSASDKLRLDMGDVEWSNTGIPGAADLMIGIGVNEEWALQDKRMLSICKNKINGRHGAVPVWIDAQRTATLSAPRR